MAAGGGAAAAVLATSAVHGGENTPIVWALFALVVLVAVGGFFWAVWNK
jgi:hypothetical protein